MPRVSVLLTTWNRPVMLAEAIASVLAQTYRDFELLILDDNSDDLHQRALLARYERHPKCCVHVSDVRPEERAARVRYAVLANVGLAMARGEYVTYLCDDDLFLPQRFEKMVERLDPGDCKVVYGSQRVTDSRGHLQFVREARAILHDAYCVVDHSSVMHTKAAAQEVGGWDDDASLWRMADAHFWRKLNQAGYAFHPIPEVLDVHRLHSASVSEIQGRTGRPVPTPLTRLTN